MFSACASPLPPPTVTEQEAADAALNILSHIQIKEISNAFHNLSERSYTWHDRTENRNSHQYESFTRLAHVDTSGVLTVIAGADSVGDLSTVIAAMIPGDSPYFMNRFKDEFSYEIEKASQYWSHTVGRITIHARPRSTQNFRSASFIYDSDSSKIVAANFHYHSRKILFEESSRYMVQLRPVGTAWVPYRLSIHTALLLPFGKQQIFARNVTFYNYITRSGD